MERGNGTRWGGRAGVHRVYRDGEHAHVYSPGDRHGASLKVGLGDGNRDARESGRALDSASFNGSCELHRVSCRILIQDSDACRSRETSGLRVGCGPWGIAASVSLKTTLRALATREYRYTPNVKRVRAARVPACTMPQGRIPQYAVRTPQCLSKLEVGCEAGPTDPEDRKYGVGRIDWTRRR